MRLAFAFADRPKWPKSRWLFSAAARLGHFGRHVTTPLELKAADRECERIVFEMKGAGLCMADVLSIARNHESWWTCLWVDLIATDAGKALADQPAFVAFADYLRAMDVVTVKERSLLPEYRALGINAQYLDQGCPSDIGECRHVDKPEWDALVWGSSKGYRQRVADVRALIDAGHSVAWAGHPGCKPRGCVCLPWCPPEKLPELASRAAVTLGVDSRHDIDGYWSDRFWLACGMGSCHVRRWTEGLPVGLPAPTYRTTDELVALVERLRTDRAERERIGRESRAWTMANHTYEHRVKELLGY